MAREPILDLATLVPERPVIRVDGQTYHLKSADELSLAESHRFTAWGKQLEELARDPDDVLALEALVSTVAWSALHNMPRDVFDRLAPVQRMAIVEVFTGLLLAKRLHLAGVLARLARQSTGVKSSPGSNTSMEATPAGGSTPPQPAY